jgi:hypothetical protein
MRTVRARVAGVAVLALLASALVSGCELREGDPREYGPQSSGDPTGVTTIADQELVS